MIKSRSDGKMLDLLHALSSELWREDSYKSAVKKTVEILEKHFGLFQFEYLQIHPLSKGVELKKSTIRVPSVSSFSEKTLRSLQKKLSDTPQLFDNPEFKTGFFNIQIEQETMFIALLAEPSGKPGLMCWRQPSLSESSPAYRLLGVDSEQVRKAIDFLICQLQSGSKWFRKLDEAQSLLYQDDLTELFNYRYLDIALESEFRRQSRFLTPFCILFIDLDGFKSVNDLFGHLVGSRILRDVGHLIKESVRDVDVVIRYGGDEFVVLLIGAATSAGILAAERIRKKIELHEFKGDNRETILLTASIGVACCPEHGRAREAILQSADATMYESKKLGKNRVSVVRRSEESPSTIAQGAYVES